MKNSISKFNFVKIIMVLMFLSFGTIFALGFFFQNESSFVLADDEQCSSVIESSSSNILGEEQKELTISSIEPQNKTYDGTTSISLVVNVSGVTNGDDVTVTATGTVQSADAGVGKSVTVTANSFVISGENSGDYFLDTTLPAGSLSVDISKRTTTFSWGLSNNNSTFSYTGASLLGNINPYYVNVNNVRQTLSFEISGSAFSGIPNYGKGVFEDSGNYTAKILTTENDSNYSLQDSTGSTTKDFVISRISPSFSYSQTCFTYSGETFDLKNYVSINNLEQTISFSRSSTFTTVAEAQSLIGNLVVSVSQSNNYEAKSEIFPLSITKATPVVRISTLPEYSYTGEEQTFDTSVFSINNSEQTVIAFLSGGNIFKYAGTYNFTIQAVESANYKAYVLDSFEVVMSKQKIDVSKFSWQSTSAFTYELGRTYTVSLDQSQNSYSSEVTPVYGGTCSSQNAGIYEATSSFILTDDDNYELTGTFPSFVWKINKRVQTIPSIHSLTTFTYDGNLKSLTFSVLSNNYFSISSYSATKAGTYKAVLSLLDPSNVVWDNSAKTCADIYVSWQIEKAVVAIPDSQNLVYTGFEQSISFQNNSLFTLINSTGTLIGDYTSYLVLVDPADYCFEGTDSPIVEYSWSIVNQQTTTTANPVVAIVIGFIIIVIAGLFFTLHFTINRRKRKTRAEYLNNAVKNKLKEK
jgi:hypothetical protein